jgi:hypothetical protein
MTRRFFCDLRVDVLQGGNGNDTFVFDTTAPGFNPSPVASPDHINNLDFLGDDRLDLGAPGSAVNFVIAGYRSPRSRERRRSPTASSTAPSST